MPEKPSSTLVPRPSLQMPPASPLTLAQSAPPSGTLPPVLPQPGSTLKPRTPLAVAAAAAAGSPHMPNSSLNPAMVAGSPFVKHAAPEVDPRDAGYFSEESVEDLTREIEVPRVGLGEMPPVDYSSSRSVTPEGHEGHGLMRNESSAAALVEMATMSPSPESGSPYPGAMKGSFREPVSPSSFAFRGDTDDIVICGKHIHSPMPKGSKLAAAMTLCSSTLGVGTLAVPSAFRSAGMVLGPLLLIGGCLATLFSIRLLLRLVEMTGWNTYERLSGGLIHPKMEKVTAALIVFFCWGTTVAYIVAIGDILSPFKHLDWFPEALAGTWGQRGVVSLYWLCFMLPLSLAKEVNSLRYAAFVSLASTITLTAAVIKHSSDSGGKNNTDPAPMARGSVDLMMSTPVIIFAYCCQTSTFIVYDGLRKRTEAKFMKALYGAMAVCTAVYLCVGISGALDFGEKTSANILKNYSDATSQPYLMIAFVAISITVTMAFPLCMFPTRDAILQVMGYTSVYATPTHIRIIISASLAILSLALGLFVPGIQIMFSLLGGICGSSLAFILPGVFTIRCKEWTVAKVGKWNVIGGYVLLIVGIASGVLGTIVSLMSEFK